MGASASSFNKTVEDLERNDPDLPELDLAKTELGDAKIRRISEALRSNKSVDMSSPSIHARDLSTNSTSPLAFLSSPSALCSAST